MDLKDKNPGKLFVLSGPSGAGKGTICRRLLEETDKLELSVSMTTRAPRCGEAEGVSYFSRIRIRLKNTYPAAIFWNMPRYTATITALPRRRFCRDCQKG